MTDQELLELAAKATGFKIIEQRSGGLPWTVEIDGQRLPWNPLTDDGAALRLAVQLGLSVEIHRGRAQPLPWLRVVDREGNWTYCGPQEYHGDELMQTRRCIVLAAAEIGKALPLMKNETTLAEVRCNEVLGGVDCIGLALDLEARAKTVESQTTERAMRAAAHGLRLLATPRPAEPVSLTTDEQAALTQALRHSVEIIDAPQPPETEFTAPMVEAIYAAWHGAGVDLAGGNWKRFVGMLPGLNRSNDGNHK